MGFFNPDNLRSVCSGTWIARPAQIELPKDRPADLPLPDLYAPITGLSIDTRTLAKSQAFLALRGENFDGHKFLADAVRAGAPLVILDDVSAIPAGGFEPHGNGTGVMRVADTAKALLRIAAAYRASLKGNKVIAVCGSNGKTTTTRLIDHLLSAGGMKGTASRKSFNNSVGVPLTILSARESDQYLICEVGTNHQGEIAQLGDVVRPDIAVITSIGREHLEGLGDLAGVAKEESGIARFVKPGGWVIATDAPELTEHLRPTKNLVTFGRSDKATFRLTAAHHETGEDGGTLHFTVNGRQHYKVPLVGEHNALNAMAALAVARRLGIDEQKSGAALATAGGADMRLQVVTARGRTILNDAYNANPDSMIAGIETLLALRAAGMNGCTRAVCILGEMLELGAASADCHRAVARAIIEKSALAGDAGIAMVVLVGEGMRAAEAELAAAGWSGRGSEADRVRWFPTAECPASAEIAAILKSGDLALVKGSRRVRLEKVVEAAVRGSPSGESAVVVTACGQGAPGADTLAGVVDGV